MVKEKQVLQLIGDLRGHFDFSSEDTNNFILGLITLKHLEENNSEVAVSEKYSWANCTGQLDEGIIIFQNAFLDLERNNPFLEGVFSKLFVPKLNVEQLRILTFFINSLPMKKEEAALTFEVVLKVFSERSGKLGGWNYTPQPVSVLMSQLLNIDGGDLYDGVCGTGQTLIEAGKILASKGKTFKLWGQDISESAYSIAVMNMLVHDFDFELTSGNTLIDPKFLEGNKLKQFDYVIMTPPFSANWKSIEIEFDMYNRFKYGIPGKTKADWLFIQHAISSMKATGKGAVLVPLGILTSGGKDKEIRENIIHEDLIESITFLPENTLTNTSIATAIVIFNKDKSEERKGKIQFVNATEYFEKDRRKILFTDEKIQSLSETYYQQKEVKSLAKMVSIEEISDANLNYAPYFNYSEVDSFIGKFEVDKDKYQKSFPDFFSLKNAGSFFKGVSAKEDDRPGKEEDYYLLQMSDVQNGQVILENLLPIQGNITTRIKDAQVQEGDILLSSRGSSIKIAVVPQTTKWLVPSQNLICFRPNKGYSPYFIKAFLESPVGMALLTINQKSSVISSLNIRDIEDVEIPSLSIEEQERIGTEVKEADLQVQNKIEDAKKEYLEKYQGIYTEMGLNPSFNPVEN